MRSGSGESRARMSADFKHSCGSAQPQLGDTLVHELGVVRVRNVDSALAASSVR